MLAALTLPDWGIILGGIAGPVVAVGALIGVLRWLNHHVARPLRIVTGTPETADGPGQPSLYELTQKANDKAEEGAAEARRAAALAREAKATAEHTAIEVTQVLGQVRARNGTPTAQIVEDAMIYSMAARDDAKVAREGVKKILAHLGIDE